MVLSSPDQDSGVSPLQFLGSEVRGQLDAAYFMRRIFECDLESSAQAALDSMRPQLDELQKELLKARGDVSRALYESLGSPENPLHSVFQRIISDVREKTSRRLVSLRSIREMSLPEGFRLRPTQERFLEKLQAYFEDGQKRSGFVKYPTGMGKTVLIGLMIRSLMENDDIQRVLVLSPRSVINQQNLETISLLQDQSRGIRVNEIYDDPEHSSEVHVGTYQLAASHMGSRKPKTKYADHYDVIFLDECHRSFGSQFMRFLRLRHPESVIIGLSATPYVGRSLDPRKLKSAFRYFEGEIDSITLKEACEEGSLPPIRAFRIDVHCEDNTEEDRTDKQLLDKVNKGARIVIAKRLVKEHIPAGEKVLIFCAGVEHAKKTAEALGKKAAVVHGKMTKAQIKRVLARNKSGEINVLTTADLLIEGFDDAQIKHIIILRPTMSMWIYEQMIGRGTRIDPIDPNKMLTIWDVVGQHSQQCTIHGLHKLYGDHQEVVRNGDILFGSRDGEKRYRGEDDASRINKFKKEDWGGFAEIKDVLLIEDVAQVLIPRDEVYYQNSENVRADLKAYAQAMGRELLTLSTGKASTVAQCCNGENVAWGTYLRNAAVYLGFAKNSNEAQSQFRSTLDRLMEIAEIEDDSTKRDGGYYNKKQYVKADLEAYAKAMRTGGVAALTCTNSPISLQCRNGDTVRWGTYLKNAAICLGLANDHREAGSRMRTTLDRLLEIVGVKKRSREYYQHSEYVRADLEAYAGAMGKKVSALPCTNLPITVQCSNGEMVKWQTYLKHAAISLCLARNTREAVSRLKATLDRLKEIAEVNVEVISVKRDREYYENRRNVKADLESFAEAMGKGVHGLSTMNPSISIQCSNGEMVKWLTYLKNAAIALGYASNTKEATSQVRFVVKRLKEIAGV